MPERPEIYLDMDGVCVDFIGAAFRAQGYDADAMLEAWQREHPGELYPASLMDRTAQEFFTHENLGTSEFWATLEPYPWFDDMFAELERLGHVVFLTAPTGSPGCVAGKMEWLIGRFGHDFHDFIFTRKKDRLAHGNAYLVDDMPFNTVPFSERGGHGMLFPQIWNELNHVDERVEHLVTALEAAISRG